MQQSATHTDEVPISTHKYCMGVKIYKIQNATTWIRKFLNQHIMEFSRIKDNTPQRQNAAVRALILKKPWWWSTLKKQPHTAWNGICKKLSKDKE